MNAWTAAELAEAAGGRLVAGDPDAPGPEGVTTDSREAGPGVLFVGLPGENVDGGSFAGQAIDAGAWGVLVAEEHAERLAGADAVVIGCADPLAALGSAAAAWRRRLGCAVIAITGSTGKTSTKDITAAFLRPSRRTVATTGNYNTEIGLPLTILGAPAGTEVLVLEAAMRGAGQIAELAGIADPDAGIIVNIGPVHLELLGTVENIAAAKAELIAGMRPGTVAVLPAGEPLLDPHLREDLEVVTFGPGGDLERLPEEIEVELPSRHMEANALAALAAVRAIGVEPAGRIELELSGLRGERIALEGGVVVINDCYNANPMSMRAALADLAESAPGRRVAVLGDMLELGPDERRFHAELGAQARDAGVDVLVTVGDLAVHAGPAWGGEDFVSVENAEQAAQRLAGLVEPGDTILVKGSRGVGLEVVAESLVAERGAEE
jgi:UDP-N-acetylmuramoyl-tripeptide--D-alanyl-D-alanine ligase